MNLKNLAEVIDQLVISLQQFAHLESFSMKLSVAIGEQIDVMSSCNAS